MRFNVGMVKLKGYHFVDVDVSEEEWNNARLQEPHKKIMKAIKDKYGTNHIIGYSPCKTLDKIKIEE